MEEKILLRESWVMEASFAFYYEHRQQDSVFFSSTVEVISAAQDQLT